MNKLNWLKKFCLMLCIVLLFSTGIPLSAGAASSGKGNIDSAAAKAYLSILQEKSDLIRFPSYTYNGTTHYPHGRNVVAVVDICGDETPELIFVTVCAQKFDDDLEEYEYGADLQVYGYENGKVTQILYSEDAVAEIGGGADFAAFLGKDNEFYIWFRHYSGTFYYRYDLRSGYLIPVLVVTATGADGTEYYDTEEYAYYDSTGKAISENEYRIKAAELTENASLLCLSSHSNEYDDTGNTNGWPFSAPKNLPLAAMTYDAAVAYLKQAADPTTIARPTSSTVLVNGKSVTFDAYNIGGNNFFKLRDIAYVLSGTPKQFEVTWDGGRNAISLLRGQAYTIIGGEMEGKGTGEKKATPTTSAIYLDGSAVKLEAFNIGGNNYFKLRDLGVAFDFGVGWDGAKNTITIDTSKGYASN